MKTAPRMVHLRTVSSPWEANVLAARLGSEGIVTQLRGNLCGPYPFGTVAVLVEEAQAGLAAELLLADEVESAFLPAAQADAPAEVASARRWRYRRLLAAAAALVVAGAPLLAHFVNWG
jgi:hypothetical protein